MKKPALMHIHDYPYSQRQDPWHTNIKHLAVCQRERDCWLLYVPATCWCIPGTDLLISNMLAYPRDRSAYQQHAGVSQGQICLSATCWRIPGTDLLISNMLAYPRDRSAYQQHAGVSQGQICLSATCWRIPGIDLFRQLHVLLH